VIELKQNEYETDFSKYSPEYNQVLDVTCDVLINNLEALKSVLLTYDQLAKTISPELKDLELPYWAYTLYKKDQVD